MPPILTPTPFPSGGGGGGGDGAPTDSPYLTTIADSDLDNEVVVGTTPQGEIGGTWGNMTVDAVHSGSSHAEILADALEAAGLAQTTADAAAPKVTPTAVKTSNYTAAANEYVPIDTSSGAVQVTLPTAPANGTVVVVKRIAGTSNTGTVVTGGSDVFNTSGGSTSATVTLLNQHYTFTYRATGATWYVESSFSLSSLDTRYQTVGIPTDKTADYTLVLTDAYTSIGVDSGSAKNVTVPLNASVAYPVGTLIEVRQVGAGQVTIVATGGVTLRSRGGALKITGQYGAASLLKVATDTWSIQGDLTT